MMALTVAQLERAASEISARLDGRMSTAQVLEILKKFQLVYPELVPVSATENCRSVGDLIYYRASRHNMVLNSGQLFFILAQLGEHRGEVIVTSSQPVLLLQGGSYTRINWNQIVAHQPQSNDRKSDHDEMPPPQS